MSSRRKVLRKLTLFSLSTLFAATTMAAPLPSPTMDPAPAAKGPQTVVFAGGCFWGVEAVFRHVRGVTSAVSGFAGGDLAARNYVRAFRGTRGDAEAVKVTYDSTQVSYADLLRIFFTVAHDPTQVDRQEPDDGAQYRSVIFFVKEGQRRAALAFIDSLDKSKRLAGPVATQLAPLRAFHVAPPQHQDF